MSTMQYLLTTKFFYHKKENSFSAEISDLPGFETAPIYNEHDDVGFVLVSRKTGECATMRLASIDKDREGDVQAWRFRPVDKRYTFTVTLFND